MKTLSRLACLPILASAAAAQAPLYDLSGQVGDQLGQSVCWVGDVDGDGQEDIALGAPNGDGLQPDAGYVTIFSSKTPTPISEFKGERTGDRCGWSIAGLGDIDGDGAGDIVIGAPGHEWFSGTERGAVYVVSGATGAQILKIGGNMDGDQAGFAVAGPGDVDGDGTPDYAFAMPWNDFAQPDGGIVWIHSGANHSVLKVYLGQAAGDLFGFSLSGAGDVSGDGVPDLLAGAPRANVGAAPDAGRAYVLSGALSNTVVFSRGGNYFAGQMGYSVSGGCDFDLDGRPDVVFGEPFADAYGIDSGRVLVISGASQAVLLNLQGLTGDTFGFSVGALSDVDLDGRADVIVGAPLADFGGITDAGVAQVRSGANGALLFELTGYHAGEMFGQSVSSAGRLNADLATDVIAGSPFFDGGSTDGGRVRTVLGSAPYPNVYCTAKTNSAGCVPWIAFTGCASFSAGDYFAVHGADVLPNMVGMLIWSTQPNSMPFHGGTLCVGPPIKRTAAQLAIVTGPNACDGRYEFQFNATYMSSQGLVPGQSIHAQYWSRDSGFSAPDNVGLTNALKFVTLP